MHRHLERVLDAIRHSAMRLVYASHILNFDASLVVVAICDGLFDASHERPRGQGKKHGIAKPGLRQKPRDLAIVKHRLMRALQSPAEVTRLSKAARPGHLGPNRQPAPLSVVQLQSVAEDIVCFLFRCAAVSTVCII